MHSTLYESMRESMNSMMLLYLFCYFYSSGHRTTLKFHYDGTNLVEPKKI